VKAEYAGVAEYLKVKVFGARAEPGPDGRLVAIDEPVAERRVIWRENVSAPMRLAPAELRCATRAAHSSHGGPLPTPAPLSRRRTSPTTTRRAWNTTCCGATSR
jgi:hypothetical protein